ncbi:MAG: MarR family transcriptional regulator, partial [Oceanospirillaceae bacterium]|nr:MarR family transcriptional regulator [Oceanospirillaceae bacterium]
EAVLRERLKRECGTTLPRFDVMAALDHHPAGLRMTELSEFLMVSNGNVTGIVNRLAEDGLVERTQDSQDRRAQTVCLSPSGHTEFQHLAKLHAQWIDDIMQPLNVEQSDTLMALLEQLTELEVSS